MQGEIGRGKWRGKPHPLLSSRAIHGKFLRIVIPTKVGIQDKVQNHGPRLSPGRRKKNGNVAFVGRFSAPWFVQRVFAARTLSLTSSTVITQAMLLDISSRAIQWWSLPRVLATQSETTIGLKPRIEAPKVVA